MKGESNVIITDGFTGNIALKTAEGTAKFITDNLKKSLTKNFKENGGQNPIEAAKLKCKIYHGPYIGNFEEIYKILEDNKISKKILNYKNLSENLIIDLENRYKQKDMCFLDLKTSLRTMLILLVCVANRISSISLMMPL